jgi:hypothetical protein
MKTIACIGKKRAGQKRNVHGNNEFGTEIVKKAKNIRQAQYLTLFLT